MRRPRPAVVAAARGATRLIRMEQNSEEAVSELLQLGWRIDYIPKPSVPPVDLDKHRSESFNGEEQRRLSTASQAVMENEIDPKQIGYRDEDSMLMGGYQPKDPYESQSEDNLQDVDL